MKNADFGVFEKQYLDALLKDVVPFWMKYSPDREHGGYFHWLDRDGSVIDTEKGMWPENRIVWTFCNLYNNLDPRPEWLEMAKLGVDFLKKYGRDEHGDWYFILTRDGKPVVQPYNIFSDCFAVMAFSEYAKATGDDEALNIAVNTYHRIQKRKANPKGKYNKIIAANRPLKSLGVPMINLNISVIMNGIEPDPSYEQVMVDSISEVMTQFVNQKDRVVHENIMWDGGYVNSSDGRHINPGHGIECMWFIMQAAEKLGDTETIRKACEVSKWCMEFGWDKEYGGIYYFMDKDGKPHPELQWDMKLWWPHLEALIAFLMGYRLTGDREMLQWFLRVHDYTWSHFPDPGYGEWFGYLNRYGKVNNYCKGNRWKAPFHLCRALFMISRLAGELRLVGPESDSLPR